PSRSSSRQTTQADGAVSTLLSFRAEPSEGEESMTSTQNGLRAVAVSNIHRRTRGDGARPPSAWGEVRWACQRRAFHRKTATVDALGCAHPASVLTAEVKSIG